MVKQIQRQETAHRQSLLVVGYIGNSVGDFGRPGGELFVLPPNTNQICKEHRTHGLGT